MNRPRHIGGSKMKWKGKTENVSMKCKQRIIRRVFSDKDIQVKHFLLKIKRHNQSTFD